MTEEEIRLLDALRVVADAHGLRVSTVYVKKVWYAYSVADLGHGMVLLHDVCVSSDDARKPTVIVEQFTMQHADGVAKGPHPAKVLELFTQWTLWKKEGAISSGTLLRLRRRGPWDAWLQDAAGKKPAEHKQRARYAQLLERAMDSFLTRNRRHGTLSTEAPEVPTKGARRAVRAKPETAGSGGPRSHRAGKAEKGKRAAAQASAAPAAAPAP